MSNQEAQRTLDGRFLYDLLLLLYRTGPGILGENLYFTVLPNTFISADLAGPFWQGGKRPDKLRVYANLNDTFAWGCTDAEEITPDDLPALAQAFEDVKRACPNQQRRYGMTLWVARKRVGRGEPACPIGLTSYYPQELRPLFEVLLK